MLPDAHTNGPLGPVLIWAECCDVISGILGSPQTYSAHLLPDTWHFLTRNTSFHATVRERERQRENSNYHRILSREVVCYWLTCIFIFSKLMLLSHFSRVQLCATPWTAAYQAPLSMGFSRQEHWSGLPFPSPMNESEKWKWSCSVVSDSSRSHGLQPTRLLCPWDFPSKSTGVGCHCP